MVIMNRLFSFLVLFICICTQPFLKNAQNPPETANPHSRAVFHLTNNSQPTKMVLYFPTVGVSCSNRFHMPNNHNQSAIEFHVKREVNDKYLLKTGSYIIFICKEGFTKVKDNLTLVTHCQANGTWSPTSDCEQSKIPGTPLPNENFKTTSIPLSTENFKTTSIPLSTENFKATNIPPPAENKACESKFYLPTNYNETAVQFDVRHEGSQKHLYLPG